ncbi:hypothetical protein [Deinococcus peraridilitoris]|uniref:Uncharacterized protein n=1 Tax=Deinococcus peraridilitoris (strain DSM 19664 / LMG 22246 / CIP 109416 / KR-200) TaxID=937777 RepID=L0A1F7_DEIPD|nr:hypothetical protein [Deinococcus peraridilitoris]AFZ67012.1 hypothetical protein Deipe_1471 [Deinococcus peraridilitoris DSM 19664]
MTRTLPGFDRELAMDEIVAAAANRGACLTWQDVISARQREALAELSDYELHQELLRSRFFYTRPAPIVASPS